MSRSLNGRDCQRPLAPVSLLFALLLALASSGAVVLAATGDGTGTVSTNLSGSGTTSSFDEGRAVAIQSDGKIVVAGNSAPTAGYTRFALARYDRNWALDNTFNSSGITTLTLGGSGDTARAVAIQPTGSEDKIVVAGRSFDGSKGSLALARFRANGDLDTAFGNTTPTPNGRVIQSIEGDSDGGANAVAIQSDGKIVVAGYYNAGWLVARYTLDGQLDTSFNSPSGTAKLNFGNPADPLDTAYAVVIQSDGKIVVAGSGNPGTGSRFALARFNPDGILDNSFDTDGKATLDFGAGRSTAYALAIQRIGGEDRIVVAGANDAGSGDYNFALARLNPNGSLDNSFDTDGKLSQDLGSRNDFARAVTIQPDGKILAAGSKSSGTGNRDFALLRFQAYGMPDSGFGTGGRATSDLSSGRDDIAYAVAIDRPADRIVVAGGALTTSSISDFAVAGYDQGLRPVVTLQPIDTSADIGSAATFAATATAGEGPTRQWQESSDGGNSWSDIAGETAESYTVTATEAKHGHRFRAMFTSYGALTSSNAATLFVNLPPAITTQPANQTACAGSGASFTVAASGRPAPTVKWQELTTAPGATWTDISGATSTTLAITASAGQDGNQYRALLTNVAGNATTSVATLTVNVAPVVAGNPPATATVLLGNSVTLTATAATGRLVSTVQWQESSDNGVTFVTIPSATSTSYTFTPLASQNGHQFKAKFINGCSQTASSATVLTVNSPPTISTHPSNQEACEGTPASFDVAGTGMPSPSIQWQVSSNGSTWTSVDGATLPTYTVPTTASQNGYRYRAVLTNVAGSATSDPAALTVDIAPTVTADPSPATKTAGESVTFTAAATGRPTPSIQWQVSSNGGSSFSDIGGATSGSYSFTTSADKNDYRYRAKFTNGCSRAGCSEIYSAAATLSVNTHPLVGTDPISQTVCQGTAVTFTAAASGTPSPSVIWQESTGEGQSFTNISGATSTSLDVAADANKNGHRFRAAFTNAASTVYSNAATLTVNTTPEFTTHPASRSVTTGGSVTFTAAATSSPVPTIQWQVSTNGGSSFSDIGGATSASYSITPTMAQNEYQYRAKFTNGSCGQAISNAATLTVNTMPSVTTQPTNQTVCEGSGVTFTAAAIGDPAPTVRWQESSNGSTWNDVGGATAATYSFSPTASQAGHQFRAVFTNAAGSVNSNPVTLTVNTVPVVSTHPSGQSVVAGTTVTFTAAATSSPAPTIQWQVSTNSGGSFSDIGGATSGSYTIPSPTAGQNGYQYRAKFTNSCSVAYSGAATLSVSTAPVITWPNPADIVYGTALSLSQLNATTTVPGIFTYTPPLGTFLNAGPAQPLAVTFTPDDTVHYTTANKSAQINVLRAPLTVTADDKGKYYGDDTSITYTASYSGFVLGENSAALGGSLAFDQVMVNDHLYSIVPRGPTSSNYDIQFVAGRLVLADREGSSSSDPPTPTPAPPTPTPPTGTPIPSATPVGSAGPMSTPTPEPTGTSQPAIAPMPSVGPTVEVTIPTVIPTGVPTTTGEGLVGILPATPGTGVVTSGNLTLRVQNPGGQDLVVRVEPAPTVSTGNPSDLVLAAFHLEVYSQSPGSTGYQKNTNTHVLLSFTFSRADYDAAVQQGRSITIQRIGSDGVVETIPSQWSPEPAPGCVWADVVPRSLYELVLGPTAQAGQASRAGRKVPADLRYSSETGFRINLDSFWDYFQKRGGVRTFGYPISREFTLQGFKVQLFQRALLQQMPDGSVQTMNLLDGGLMPYSRINFSSFPSADREMLAAAPSQIDPNYGESALAFIDANVSDEWEGMGVNFRKAFMDTVRYEDAFPTGGGNSGLLALFNLEIWGFPTSRPQRDPSNSNFVYQRFQRGILHYDATTGATGGLLLGDYLKSLINGNGLPEDLAEQAKDSAFLRQYDPAKPRSLSRPGLLANTDLDGAFEREQTE